MGPLAEVAQLKSSACHMEIPEENMMKTFVYDRGTELKQFTTLFFEAGA